ncbi:hypothetical protein GOP47_0013014, partial [Adiantum capillus-veneris]
GTMTRSRKSDRDSDVPRHSTPSLQHNEEEEGSPASSDEEEKEEEEEAGASGQRRRSGSPSNSAGSDLWNSECTDLLIAEYTYWLVSRGSVGKQEWQLIVERLNKFECNRAGARPSEAIRGCKDKMERLKRAYIGAMRRGDTQWPFYEQMRIVFHVLCNPTQSDVNLKVPISICNPPMKRLHDCDGDVGDKGAPHSQKLLSQRAARHHSEGECSRKRKAGSVFEAIEMFRDVYARGALENLKFYEEVVSKFSEINAAFSKYVAKQK